MNNNSNSNNNSKNKISNNYQDYKYVYKGYEDFTKNHHLTKDEIKKEKENIIHDHRNQFDFNNPNQHQHDYSFDFAQIPKSKQETTYKDKYGNTYQNKPTTYPSNSKSNYSSSYQNNSNKTNNVYKSNSSFSKLIKTFIILLFVLPIIFNIIVVLFSFIYEQKSNSYNDYEETETIYDEDENTSSTYKDPIDAFCRAISEESFIEIWDYITNEEYRHDNGNSWRNIIYSTENNQSSYTSNKSCEVIKTTYLSTNEINNLQNEFNNKYNSNKIITEAYRVLVKEKVNNQAKNYYYITVGKIDNSWFLIKNNII